MAHTDTDIYRERLGNTYPRLGHALWEPTSVDVGDVGCIRDGKFLRLFNALYSESHPSNQRFGIPDYHEPLVPSISDHLDLGILKRSHYCSAGVKVTGGPDSPSASPDEWNVLYSNQSKRGGAVLYLPVDAQRQGTLARRDFGQWMVRHIDSWLAFARRLGMDIEQMEDIILVTGCHRTRSWANVTFLEGHTDAQALFRIKEEHDPVIGVKWKFSPLSVQGAICNWVPEEGLTEDRSIFIRGFRVVRPFGLLPRQLRGAGPDPSLHGDDDDNDDEPPTGLTLLPGATMYCDPIHVLLEYIASQAPVCDMVLVHDDNLASIYEMCENIGCLQPDVMMGLLQGSKPDIIQHVVRKQSSSSASSPGTKTEAVTVAMLSEEFQEWSRAIREDGMAPLEQLDHCRTMDTAHIASDNGVPSYTDEPSVIFPPTPLYCPIAPTTPARDLDGIIDFPTVTNTATQSVAHFLLNRGDPPRSPSVTSSMPFASVATVPPERKAKTSSKRKRQDPNDEFDVNQDVVGPSIDPNIPQPPSQRPECEYLAQAGQNDGMIEPLREQPHNPYLTNPLSAGAYHLVRQSARHRDIPITRLNRLQHPASSSPAINPLLPEPHADEGMSQPNNLDKEQVSQTLMQLSPSHWSPAREHALASPDTLSEVPILRQLAIRYLNQLIDHNAQIEEIKVEPGVADGQHRVTMVLNVSDMF